MDLTTSGKRILYARNLASLTRKDFCKKHDIPIITLRSWESSVNIKVKAAKRFSAAINKEGVYCDPVWLMSGVGRHPHALTHNGNGITDNTSKIFGAPFDEQIVKEIHYLKKTYKNIIHQLVVDNSMHPFLHPGDYIAGFYTTNPTEYVGCPCIIETVSGQNLIGIVNEDNNAEHKEEDEDKKKYTLTALNPMLSRNLSLLKKEIKKIAKIFWMRKRK